MTNTERSESGKGHRYHVLPVSDLRVGDRIKISRAVITAVNVGADTTTLSYRHGAMGALKNSTKVGIYRRVSA